jgi:hypothetical protein
MADINRRQALAMGIGAVAAAAMPTSLAAAPITEAAKPELVAWMVGTPGEFDWQMIRARTYQEAIREFACEAVGGEGCEDDEAGPDGCGDCEFCYAMGAEAERQPAWDGKDHVTSADWLRAGMGTICARCRDEVYVEDNGLIVGDSGIHEGCMTLADWDIADPAKAAAIRAKQAPAMVGEQGQ